MVVICLPTASLACTPQERIATPSIWTVQAPHCAMPQPYLVPVRPAFSLIAQSSGVSGSTSTSNALPLIVRFAIAFPRYWFIPSSEPGTDVGPEFGIVQIKSLRRGKEDNRGAGVVALFRSDLRRRRPKAGVNLA